MCNVYYSWVLYSSGTGTGDCSNHAKDVAEKSDNDHIIGKLIQPTIQPEDAAALIKVIPPTKVVKLTR